MSRKRIQGGQALETHFVDKYETHMFIWKSTMESCQYLGPILLDTNTIVCVEVKWRILTDNRCYYVNTKLFCSKILSRNSTLKIYKSLNLVVTYAVKCGASLSRIGWTSGLERSLGNYIVWCRRWMVQGEEEGPFELNELI